ncbi:MAG: iron-sulfur cluster-binding protein [Chloroflexi bacterium]|nr:iron-sulfur cluster-binding protein [Chloroflexota bacterium]
MSEVPAHIDFRANVQRVPPHTPVSVRKATSKFLDTRQAVVEVVSDERWQALRQAGHEIRLHTLAHLDHYLARLEEKVRDAGGIVHWARDAADANRIVVEIARAHHVTRAVKVKSMATEEIGLNHALQANGIPVLETDLGEFIIQLAGVGPSHIIAPAVHLTKEDIAALFTQKLGVDAPPDPLELCAIARARLREEFLAADLGISGANFLVAETGTLVIVTNEGNGRMCTTLPPLHIAIVGIDKVVPNWEAVNVLLKLLPRSATGQKMSAYTSFITGPRRSTEEGGPQEFHLVLLDNGRTRILKDQVTRETLLCIRCGVCLNVCPVYNHVGGHAYGFAYSGPLGAMLSTQLLGLNTAADLPFASSLCGACAEYCPVKIPIPEILLRLRRRAVEGDQIERAVAPAAIQTGAKLGALTFGIPWVYEFGTQMLKYVQAPLQRNGWLPHLPPPAHRWTMARPFPAFGAHFRAWFRKRKDEGGRMKDEE